MNKMSLFVCDVNMLLLLKLLERSVMGEWRNKIFGWEKNVKLKELK